VLVGWLVLVTYGYGLGLVAFATNWLYVAGCELRSGWHTGLLVLRSGWDCRWLVCWLGLLRFVYAGLVYVYVGLFGWWLVVEFVVFIAFSCAALPHQHSWFDLLLD
jgi:hypothetical protein